MTLREKLASELGILAFRYFTEKDSLQAVKQNGYALLYVKDQTPDICREAVKEDGDALKYVKHQTPDICIEAIKQDGYALEYVKL